jgi:hypothetical protein
LNINPLEGDIKIASDITLSNMFKKINELVSDNNDNLKSFLKIQNDMAELRKDIKEIKLRLMNL